MNKTKKILLVLFTVVIVSLIAVIPVFAFNTFSYFNHTDYSFGISFINNGTSAFTHPVNGLSSDYISVNDTTSLNTISFRYNNNTPQNTDLYIVFSELPVSYGDLVQLIDPSYHVLLVPLSDSIRDYSFTFTSTSNLRVDIYDHNPINQPYPIGTFLTDSLKSGFSIAGDFGTAVKNTFDGVFLKVDPETGNYTGISNFGSVSLVIIGISIVTGVGILVFIRFFKRS